VSKWIKVCLAEDVPENKIKKFPVGDFDIVIANYGDGLRAFPPVCPHMREPLDVSGFIDNDVLTCGKHIWQWDLRACTKASKMTEENLLFYELKEEDGGIFVDISEQLSYAWEEEEEELDDDDFFG
jgi:toluene monooxygenase system ferredoxin subunit